MPIDTGLYDAVVVFCDGYIRDGKTLPEADTCISAITRLLDDAPSRGKQVESKRLGDTEASSSQTESKVQLHESVSLFRHPLTYRLVTVVFRQRYQLHIKRTTHLHRKPESLLAYKRMYVGGMKILDIARRPEVNYSPYLLARIIVEEMAGIPRTDLAAVVRDPSLIVDDRLRGEVR
jgi:hypothetical protein